MTKPHILQVGPYPEWDQVPLDAAFHMHRYFEATDKGGFPRRGRPAGARDRHAGRTWANAAMIAACPALEVISVYGVGYDAVDLAAARARGIRVTNTPDVLTDDCADLAVAMLLALSRGVVGAEAWARSGAWAEKGGYPLQRKVTGKRVGILGLGRIGAAIARRLQGFDMAISYSGRAPRETPAGWTYVADPVTLAGQVDYLVVALSATPETRHIVGAEVLAALGPKGMLINISRAPNVDESALLDALEAGQLAGAALDVFEGEPRLNPRFLTAPNVLLQPHHASGTFETRQAMGKLVRDNLIAHFAGQPLLTPVA